MEEGKGREEGRPDINFAHARGKLVGTESRRMKLEPETAADVVVLDRGMKCRFAVGEGRRGGREGTRECGREEQERRKGVGEEKKEVRLD